MPIPDWRKLVFGNGILAESVPDDSRIVFWLPDQVKGRVTSWERIASVAGAEVREQQGLLALPAASIRGRPPSLLGRLRQRLSSGTRGQVWTLPNGQQVEQVGERRSDLLLVWSGGTAVALDDARLKSCWPESQGFQKIAENLILVRGVQAPAAKSVPEIASTAPESPIQLAEQMLEKARRTGDPNRIATALTDLGILLTRLGQGQRAASLLEEALTLSQQTGNRALESDVRDSLALAVLGTGQAPRALELFQQGLADARAAGSPFAEKMALSHLALAYSAMRDFGQAASLLNQALSISRQVGDRQHEADLLWQQAIIHAETGQRPQAVASAEEAVYLYQQLHNPQADWLESQLQKFRADPAGASLSGLSAPASASIFGGQMVASGWTESATFPGAAPGGSGPGLLRMAFSAMKSMAHFAGSGFKPASALTVQKRLQTCAPCEHHTGLRCRICGCFTTIKARLPHESCPIGKW